MTTNQITLTPRQLEVLQITAQYQNSQCYSMTVKEMADALGVSRTTAFEHIAGLKEKALLSARHGKARSLKLTQKGQRLLDEANGRQRQQQNSNKTNGLPLLGRVAAGVPIEAIENTEQVSLRSEFGSGDDVFALRVQGDSMLDDGICDGDYVICKHSCTANNGQIVVAIIDEQDATVKRFYKEAGKVRLVPANENYEPIYSDNCRVTGIVVGLMRKM